MKVLEIYIAQEVLALQKTIVKRFEMTEEIFGVKKLEKTVQGQDLTLPYLSEVTYPGF